MMFVILQKYDFSSKSQRIKDIVDCKVWCLWYCKSTIFQANHNRPVPLSKCRTDVCDTAKVRFFKQITTAKITASPTLSMFVILQKYDFSSKSQQLYCFAFIFFGCLWYCKSTIFQANHNSIARSGRSRLDVCDTAKVRFFKQITTLRLPGIDLRKMFVILQKYDFSSKSQLGSVRAC